MVESIVALKCYMVWFVTNLACGSCGGVWLGESVVGWTTTMSWSLFATAFCIATTSGCILGTLGFDGGICEVDRELKM